MKNKLLKVFITFFVFFLFVIPSVKSYAVEEVDPYMQTESYSTYIEVYGNNTYLGEETITVNFLAVKPVFPVIRLSVRKSPTLCFSHGPEYSLKRTLGTIAPSLGNIFSSIDALKI